MTSVRPGEVWSFWGDHGSWKHHLCVSEERHFLYLNTPRKSYRGQLIISNAEVPFLPRTPTGTSAISCTHLTTLAPNKLLLKRTGVVGRPVMRRLVAFLERTEALTDLERDVVLEGLYDYYAEAA